ncbi:MAG: ribose 5-phosphate isomerase B [Candidatus Paceibacteria bacterium]|jgi:ribose 5-phosphate isomerase B
MHIHLATDHAGYEHKNAVAQWLQMEGYTVTDHGAAVYDPADDYPDFIARAAMAISRNPNDRAIIFGGSGQGEAMLANRFPAVRATVLYSNDLEIVQLSREHNDANVLSIGARFLSVDQTKKHVWDWLHAERSDDERHNRRIEKVAAITKNIHI